MIAMANGEDHSTNPSDWAQGPLGYLVVSNTTFRPQPPNLADRTQAGNAETKPLHQRATGIDPTSQLAPVFDHQVTRIRYGTVRLLRILLGPMVVS